MHTALNVFVRGLMASSAVLAFSTPVLAQVDGPGPEQVAKLAEQLKKLEERIEARGKEQKADEELLKSMREKLGMPKPEEGSPTIVKPSSRVPLNLDLVGFCRMHSEADMNQAFLDPYKCRPDEKSENDGSREAQQAKRIRTVTRTIPKDQQLEDALSPANLPGRVIQPAGLNAALDLAQSDRASISYTRNFAFRIKRTKANKVDFDYQRPQLLKLTGTVSTPISNGRNRLIDLTNDPRFSSGTSFKAAVDFQNFRKEYREDAFARAARFLYKAMGACLADRTKKEPSVGKKITEADLVRHFKGRPIPAFDKGDETAGVCQADRLINWIFERKVVERRHLGDPPDYGRTTTEKVLKNPDLAKEYVSIFWSAPTDKPIPQLGWGLSAEYSSTDFTHFPGVFTVTDEGRSLDRSVPLGDKVKNTFDQWTLEGYGSTFIKTREFDPAPSEKLYADGIMLLGAVTYQKLWDIPKDAKNVEICADNSNPDIVLGQCSALNVDGPRQREGFTLSLEGRVQFNNVPLVKLVGLAPRYSYRLDDGFQKLDLPLYLTANDKGIGTTGIVLSGTWGGENLIGEELDSDFGISLFYSLPLNFNGR